MRTIAWTSAFLIIFDCTGGANVITGSNITLDSGTPLSGSDYNLTVYQDEAGTDPTSIFFDVSGLTLSIVTYNVDEASDWYLSTLNEEFSEVSIGNNAHPVFIQHVPSLQSNDLNPGSDTFYLGVNTGLGFNGGDPNRGVYGWAMLRNTGGNLELLDNAVAYGGAGIYAGTTIQIVPEPSTFLLLGGGCLVLHVLTCRKREPAEPER